MLPKSINLGIAADHTIFGKILKKYLSEQRDFNVLLVTTDIIGLVNRLKEFQIDILLLSMFTPESNGLRIIQTIREKFPDLKILLLSASTDPGLISSFLELEIYGYISGKEEPEDMLKAIILTSEDKIYKTRLVTEAMYLNQKHTIKTNSLKSGVRLSDRDKKIMRLLMEEKNNRQIAEELFLSIRSVEKIRQNIKRKLGVKSTIGMLKYLMK